MVNWINVAVNHGGSLRISTCHQHQGRVEHVGLKTDGNQSLDVLLCGDQDLAAHVAALLGARLLVLNVDASSSVLDEHLRQLHGGSDASVAGVSISDDGIQVVHAGSLGAFIWLHATSLLILLAIVEQLGTEELIHLVGHGVVRVVCHIWAGLVGGGGSGRALPSADVHGGQVLGHLSDLNCVKGAEGVGAGAFGLVLTEHLVQLLRHLGSVEGHRESTLELHHVLHLVWTCGVLEALTAHPLLHGLHSGFEVRLFVGRHCAHLQATRHGCIAGQNVALNLAKTVGHGSIGQSAAEKTF
mmetsp:Transcript_39892/g.49290  ORF Transcript_39892/g.49290 Transcript_39892/m.49290 type:complete len:299 (-) Transcript_39892:19-915(-)